MLQAGSVSAATAKSGPGGGQAAVPSISCPSARDCAAVGFLLPPEHCTYLLARCDNADTARQVAKELQAEYSDDMTAKTAEEFSEGSRWYWLFRTKAGIAIGYAALLGLFAVAIAIANVFTAKDGSHADLLQLEAVLMMLTAPAALIGAVIAAFRDHERSIFVWISIIAASLFLLLMFFELTFPPN